jgi:hypothetical protein
MKKLFILFALITVFASCASSSEETLTTTFVDTTMVDTMVVDTTVVDTIAPVDTVK